MADHGAPASSRSAMGRWALVGGFIVAFLGGLAAVTGHLKTIWTNVNDLLGQPLSSTSATSSLPRLVVRDAAVHLRVTDLTGGSGGDNLLVEITIEKEGPEEIDCKPQIDLRGRRSFGAVDGQENFDLPAGLVQRLIYGAFPVTIGRNFVPEANVRLVCSKVITEWTAVDFIS